MKLNVRAFAHAVAVTWVAMYATCRILFALAPKETMSAFEYVMHTDLNPIVLPVTWGGFFVGLVCIYAVVALAAGAAAWLYNEFAGHNVKQVECRTSYGPTAGGKLGHHGV